MSSGGKRIYMTGDIFILNTANMVAGGLRPNRGSKEQIEFARKKIFPFSLAYITVYRSNVLMIFCSSP